MQNKTLFNSFKTWHILLLFALIFFIGKYVDYLIVIQKTGEITYSLKFFFLNYLLYLIGNLLVIGFIGLSIFTGAYILKFRITLKASYKATILASFVYFIRNILRWCWVATQTSFTREEFSDKYLFKLSSIIDVSPLNTTLFKIANGFDIYDIVFVIALSFLLTKLSKISYVKSLKIIGMFLIPIVILSKLLFSTMLSL